MKAKKWIETKKEGEYEITKFHVKECTINKDLFYEICEFVGEPHDYLACCFYDINENYLMYVDDTIEDLHSRIEDFEEEEKENIPKKYIEILKPYEGYNIFE